MDAKEGVEQGDITPINGVEGVYPPSFFDLNKFTTHWKLADDPIAAQDAWIGLTGENFKIRGPNYLKDKTKILSKECVFKCLCCELVNSKTRMDDFSARPASLVQKLRSQGYKGLIYVYNIMVSLSREIDN